MSPISTTGARIDRSDNGRPVRGYHARLIEALKLERSSRFLCSEVFITFISKQHDDGADLILAPYRYMPPAWRSGMWPKSQQAPRTADRTSRQRAARSDTWHRRAPGGFRTPDRT